MSAGVQISIQVRKNFVSENFDAFVEDTHKVTIEQLRQAGKRTVEIVTKYPDVYSSDEPYPWVSEAQRLYVLIHIALGDIVVPRPRTGRFGESWTIEEYKQGVRVSSNYRGARQLVGTETQPEKQSSLHAGRWTPLRTATETAIADLPVDIKENIILAARRRGFYDRSTR